MQATQGGDPSGQTSEGDVADRELFERAVEEFARSKRRGSRLRQAKEPQVGRPMPRRRRRGGAAGAVEAQVDLHGLDAATARQRIDQFLARQRSGARVLIVHGRGTGKLAGEVCSWLETDGRVLSHETAPGHLGGVGARLVCMRKGLV